MLEKFEYDLCNGGPIEDTHFVVQGLGSGHLYILTYRELKPIMEDRRHLRTHEVVAAYITYEEAVALRELMYAAREDEERWTKTCM
jgi:hypothetical protein